jgi:DNA-binding transcriptional ArsR family regulator
MNKKGSMPALNPTLWRTCRMLAGATRVKLLRELHGRSGRTVTELAQAAGVGISDASQELRRIQSRGFLRADRRGPYVRYRLGADPQVASAAPLLRALRTALAQTRAAPVPEIIRIAQGLAHPRRIAIARALRRAPRRPGQLRAELGLATSSARPHLARLVESGLVKRRGDWLVLEPTAHPLAKALARLLEP